MIETSTITGIDIREEVLFVLRYYSFFRYPLKVEEVHGSCPAECSLSRVIDILKELVDNRIIYACNTYYSLSSDIQEEVIRRKKGKERALIQKNEAIRIGNFIYGFPFVRFVGISGSLSKGYADEKTDFDFFIVTEANRLWIARTALHLFKKFTFLLGRQDKYCMNYFIDTEKMEIEEKNHFTAIEISSLIPVNGYELYTNFLKENNWVNSKLPNGYVPFSRVQLPTKKQNTVKHFVEGIVDLLFPSFFNKKLMWLTDYKWRRKWKKKNYPMKDYDQAFKTTLHISKNHPANYQKKILNHLSATDV